MRITSRLKVWYSRKFRNYGYIYYLARIDPRYDSALLPCLLATLFRCPRKGCPSLLLLGAHSPPRIRCMPGHHCGRSNQLNNVAPIRALHKPPTLPFHQSLPYSNFFVSETFLQELTESFHVLFWGIYPFTCSPVASSPKHLDRALVKYCFRYPPKLPLLSRCHPEPLNNHVVRHEPNVRQMS